MVCRKIKARVTVKRPRTSQCERNACTYTTQIIESPIDFKKTTTKPIQLALIGVGGQAHHSHLPALEIYRAQHPGTVECIAIVDPDMDRRQAAQYRFSTAQPFADIDQMLTTIYPDAALVLTPYWLNGEVAAAALEGGMHVFMEKPPGMSTDQLQRLIDLSLANDLIAQVGYNRRHWPALKLALEWLEESDQPLQYLRGTKHRTDRINEAYAFYTSSHVIDLLVAVGGEPAYMTNIRQPIPNTEAFNFFTTIHFCSGAVAHATGMPHVSYNQEIYEFHSLDSTVVVDQHWGHRDQPAAVRQYRGNEMMREEYLPKGEAWPRVDGYLGQLEVFFAALLGSGEAFPTVEDCAYTIALTEAIQHGKQEWSNE
jgi:predicted dehydrogenase